MPIVVSAISQKGGVGKSAVARLVAREYAASGWAVRVADFDLKQMTTTEWAARRLAAGIEPCMGLLMSSVFHRGFSILPIPMFDQRDHPSVPTMNVAGHGGGWRSRMARRATAEGGARRP